MPNQPFSAHSFQTFGDLLKYLRRRERLTQLELSIAVGYSEAQIGRLEKNQRRPDISALRALFIPALHMEQEPELIARLLELAQSAREENFPAPGIAPYKGLLSFEPSDADLFFGREALTAHLAGRVAALVIDSSSRFLAVVGASGVGKSSLVRAGLGIALGHAGWDVRILTPGRYPLKALATVLEQEPGRAAAGPVLILVDQFEESFTLCRDESERMAFIERLLGCASEPTGRTSVMIVLRADFYSHCAQYPSLRRAISAEQEFVGPMSVEELRRAIEQPAKRSGWEFEPGLVDVLLNDLGAHPTSEPEPGALPLLSHALLASWERRRGHTLTLEGYHASGGVRGAIAETAESVFTDQLDQAQQKMARDVFLRLSELGEGTQDTRRRAALSELVRQPGEATQLRAVLDILAEARLITINEDSAEVAHEAVIREWHRLNAWLTDDREGLLVHRHLTNSSHEWEARGQDPSELYRGARLAQAREWASLHQDEMNAAERAFLAAAIEASEHEAREREARRQRELEIAQHMAQAEHARAEEQMLSADRLQSRSRLITILGSVALSLALLAGVLGWISHQNEVKAQREQRASVSRELASASMTSLNADPELGTLLALQAIRTTRSSDRVVLPEAMDALYRAISMPHPQLTITAQGPVDRILYSPDGRLLAAYDASGARKIWNASTGQELLSLPAVRGASLDLAFSPDGGALVASDVDQNGRAAISFWELESGKLATTTHLDMQPQAAHFSRNELSPDGTRLALASDEGTAAVWDTATGRQLMSVRQSNAVTAVVFSRNGRRLATADRSEIKVWDVPSGKEVAAFSKPNQLITSMDFSPDGNRLAASNYYSLIWLWDLRTGRELHTLYGHTNTVNSVHFSEDGTRLVSSGSDRKVIIWDTGSGEQLLSLSGHTNAVSDSMIAPDGAHVATASQDHTVKIWSTSPGGEFPSLNTGGLITIFDPGQKRIALSFADRPAEIWDFPAKQRLFSLTAHSISWVYRFSADGKRLASKSPDGTVSLWDATDGKELWRTSASPVGMVIPSPDGTRVAIAYDTANAPGVAEIWDARTNQRLLSLSGHAAGVWALAYSADGKRIATGDNAGMVKIWNAESGRELLTLEHSAGSKIRALVFSRDGKYLASGSQNGVGKIWDSISGNPVLTLLGHTSTLKDVAFSPNDAHIATAGYDGTVRVWDARSGAQVQTFYGESGGFWTVDYTPDGKRLVAATDSGTVRTYLLDVDELIALAQAGLTRTLSVQECQRYLHMQTCPTSP